MNPMIELAYIISAILFIVGLKGLAHPRTAVRGNLLGALGMLLAAVVTLLMPGMGTTGFVLIGLGLIIGGGIGYLLATRVQMTQMPQMVALLNGFGGIASVIVAGAALGEVVALFNDPNTSAASLLSGSAGQVAQFSVATFASGLIGAVTFWGSLVAYLKLEEISLDQLLKRIIALTGRSQPSQGGGKTANTQGSSALSQFDDVMKSKPAAKVVLLVICVLLGLWLIASPTNVFAYWLIVVVASVLGWYLVMPIGGADMPVVIALLNSYSGLAGAATGFVINNSVLIITGSLVGASGIILSLIMCKAMNRSLTNVLFGVWVADADAMDADEVYAGKIKSSSAEELAMLLDGVGRVVIVPGYGLAVAQAQHAVRDLANLLESRGTVVEFAIHPVAGRMPGHMNVLLAEADISYEKVKEMDEINPTFEQTDVAIVIGANDVTNPLARTDPKSPIAGMPILDVSHAKSVIVVKRSLSPGFAGIPNPLFADEHTLMFFADAKRGMIDLVNALKEQ